MKNMVNRKMAMPIKADKVQVVLEKRFGRPFEKKELLAMLIRLSKYRRGILQNISELETEINEYLKEVNINPRSAYRWIHTTLLPAEYLDQINRNKLTSNRARYIYNNSERRRKATVGLEILKLGREIALRCLK